MHGAIAVVGTALAGALTIQVATSLGGSGTETRGAQRTSEGAAGGAEPATAAPAPLRPNPVRPATRDAIARALERALSGASSEAGASALRIDGDAFYDGDSDLQQSSCTDGPVSYIAESFSATSGGPTMDGWTLWTKGALLKMHDFGSERAVLSVRARGRFGGRGWPRLVLTMDGEPLGEALVDSATFADYDFGLVGTGAHEIGIWFVNDYYDEPNADDRNLYVDSVTITPTCP